MRARIGLLGVPTSAGAHGPGQEKAPAHLRGLGLLDRLRAAGVDVEDLGDLPLVRFQPDREHPRQQSLDRVVEVARRVAGKVEAALDGGLTPFVVGGDCTILLGVLAALTRQVGNPGLVYFDGDADLKTPGTGHSGIFDSMGMAHVIGEGAAELSHIGERFPLLPQRNIALFGFHPYEVEQREAEHLSTLDFLRYPVTELGRDPRAKAQEAVRQIEDRADRIIVHFDVDVIDAADFPLADWPHYEALTLAHAIQCLQVFMSSPKFGGLVLTEVNPDHDPDGRLSDLLMDGLVEAWPSAVQ